MTITSNQFYEQLKALIPNLPDEAISIDIHARVNELVAFTIKAYVLDKQHKHIIVDESLTTEIKRYKLIEIVEEDANISP